jgi:hypothetical protein
MKKLLPLIALLTFSGIYNTTKSQCLISDLKVRLVDVNTSNCEATFDFTWTQDVNLGNKYAYIHMWLEPLYHTPAANWTTMYSNTSSYPTAADLVNALTTIVIDNNASDFPSLGTVYHPDPTYVLSSTAGMSIVKTHLNNTLIERMTVKNIKVKLPDCPGAKTIVFDIWASQAQNGKNVHCAVQGAKLVINEIQGTGLLYCTTPRQFQVFIQNSGPALSDVKYNVFLDEDPKTILTPLDTLVYTSAPVTLPTDGLYASALTGYLPYSNNPYSARQPLLVEVTIPDRPNTTLFQIANACAPLPVRFLSFTIQQQADKIILNWQTAMEQKNNYFEVQRKVATGPYQTIASIPTKAFNGNSGTLLNYQYVEADNLKGAGQLYYRIKQVDLDGNFMYSEIRSLKNEAARATILVYPNPGNGMVNVVIPDGMGAVDLVVNNIDGKEIRRWNAVVSRQVQLTQLNPGTYTLRTVVRQTGEVLVNRIVIQ